MKQDPCAIEIEKAVLGEILQGTSLENLEGLKTDHFFNRNHQVIYQTALMMDEKREKVDLITLTNKLKDLKMIDQVGGAGYVSSLLHHVSMGTPHVQILEEKLKLRKIIEAADFATNQAYSQDVDSNTVLRKLESELFCLQSSDNSGSLTEKSCLQVLQEIELKRKGKKVAGLRTGIQPWDETLGGLRKSRFYVLAARAGKGKTAMIEQIITVLLLAGIPVLLFEKDMSPALLIQRMACRSCDIPFYRFDIGECTEKEYDAISKAIQFFQKAPLYIYSPSDFTPSTMLSIIKREKKIHGIEAVFVDHVLNLNVGAEFRTGLTLASTRIRASVEETEIPHVIIAQLNREGHGNERPSPKHIKEFDALYADCDAMLMLWSEKDTHDVPRGELFPVKLTCNKNRYGSEFEDELGFDRPLMKFKPLIQKSYAPNAY